MARKKIGYVAASRSIKIRKAALEFIKRRERDSHPAGSFDSKGRWYADRYYTCCYGIRAPSRRWPYSEMQHCRTAAHIAHEFGVPVKEIRLFVRRIQHGKASDTTA